MAERSVTVRLLALTSQYDQAMRNSGRATADLGTQAQLSGAKAQNASAEFDTLGKKINSADKSAKDAKPSFSALGISIAAFGPALVPLGGLAVAGAGALGVMGAAGILAFKGIEAEMSSGTGVGKVYTAQLATLHTNLLDLEHTAAAGIMAPFADVVARLQTQMPFLNTTVSTFANLTGKSADNLESGLIGVLHTAMPLLTEVGLDVEHLTARFDAWGQNGGGQKFAAWAQAELPTIGHDVELVAQALEHVVAATAPLGMMSLSELGMFAKAINAIPLPVLQALIPLLVNGYLALKAYEGINLATSRIGEFTTKLRASSEVAATSAASQAADAAAIEAASIAQANVMYQTAAAAELSARLESGAAGEAAAAYVAAAAETEAALEAEAAAMVAATEASEAAATARSSSVMSIASLGAAAGGVAAVLGIGLFAFEKYSQGVEQTREQVQSLTQAIEEDNGVLGDNARALVVDALTKNGALQSAKELGIGLNVVTDAAMGNADALAQVNTVIADNKNKWGVKSTEAGNLARQLGMVTGETAKAVQAAKDHAAAMKQDSSATNADAKAATAAAKAITAAGDAASKSFSSAEDIVGGFQLSATAADVAKAQKAYDAAQKSANNATKSQTQLEARLHGVRKQSLSQQQQLANAQDKTNQATQAASQAKQQLATVTAQAAHPDQQYRQFLTDQLKQAQDFVTGVQSATKRGLNQNTVEQLLEAGPKAAAPVLQALAADHSGGLIKLVNQTEQTLSTLNQQTVEDARLTQRAISSGTDQMTRDLSNALSVSNLEVGAGGTLTTDEVARKLGLSTDVATRIGDEFGITFAKATAGAITSFQLAPFVNGGAGGHHLASGGLVTGPGTATSDSIPARLSAGEFVVNAAATKSHLGLLQAINSQPVRSYAAGGYVAPPPGQVTYQTVINIDQVVTPDPNAFLQEMGRRKRLAAVSGRPNG